jgi:hypothetical protein
MASPRSPLLLITTNDAGWMRTGDSRVRANLAAFFDRAMKAGPWSVTFHRPDGALTQAGPNDYFSEGPYWWPDVTHPSGPYVRKDGERNPNRFVANHNDLGRMSEAVLGLGIGAYLLDKPRCIRHAEEIVSVWFVDPKTRMNTNLEYGQAIRGRVAGRGTGMIDTVSFIYAAQGITLLEATGAFDSALARQVREWFAEYLHWAMTSGKGQHEKFSGNNHATWWTAQAAAYAIFTGNTAAAHMTWNHYRDYLVPTEVLPNGSCPREEARTKSLNYSSMNLNAFSIICRLAQLQGVDLWHFETKSRSVQKAFLYLIPYVLHPESWHKQQIAPYNAGSHVFPGLAGIGLPSRELLSAYDELRQTHSPWPQFVELLVKSTSPDRG